MNTGLLLSVGTTILGIWLPLSATAADEQRAGKPHGKAEVQKDIADHRTLAEAHLNAAKCLEGGRSEKQCHSQLAKDCKGAGIGKYCGLKHRH